MTTALYFTAAIVGLALPAAAMAGANKTWVSGTGKDAGTCQITAPCASFQYAVNQTAAGGEVDVKDAGGYGVVTITKAISIVADGVLASISVPAGGTGVTVSAGFDDFVILRGLTIDGHLLGGTGIVASSPTIITKSALRNLQIAINNSCTEGIEVDNNEISRNNYGLYMQPDSIASISNNRFTFFVNGVYAVNATVRSFGDNKFYGGINVNGQLTSALPQ